MMDLEKLTHHVGMVNPARVFIFKFDDAAASAAIAQGFPFLLVKFGEGFLLPEGHLSHDFSVEGVSVYHSRHLDAVIAQSISFFVKFADIKPMNVSSTSMVSELAALATRQASQQVQADISLAVLKNLQDQQEVMGEALVKMINGTTLDGTGRLVNRTA